MIVSLSGFIGSGKDTVADILVSKHGFVRESWAGILKDVLSVMFGWNREWLEGKTPGSRKWREQSDKWWSERLGFDVSPRIMMQQLGTEIMRGNLHSEIWVACLENKLRSLKQNVVISDTRFENELQSIKNNGGFSLRVKRGDDPEWAKDYMRMAFTEWQTKYPNIHASEYSSLKIRYDLVIENNSTLQDLEMKINDLVQYRLSSM